MTPKGIWFLTLSASIMLLGATSGEELLGGKDMVHRDAERVEERERTSRATSGECDENKIRLAMEHVLNSTSRGTQNTVIASNLHQNLTRVCNKLHIIVAVYDGTRDDTRLSFSAGQRVHQPNTDIDKEAVVFYIRKDKVGNYLRIQIPGWNWAATYRTEVTTVATNFKDYQISRQCSAAYWLAYQECHGYYARNTYDKIWEQLNELNMAKKVFGVLVVRREAVSDCSVFTCQYTGDVAISTDWQHKGIVHGKWTIMILIGKAYSLG